MSKFISLFGFVIFFTLTLFSFAFPQASTEQLVISTYYPSPYGSYADLTTNRMKIGTTYSAATTAFVSNGLIVEGNAGIGTSDPESRLQVTGGGLCVGSDANCNNDNNVEGVVYSSNVAMTVYDVAENFPTRENPAKLTEGELLVLDLENPVFVKSSYKPYDSLVVGVVSLKPGVLLGGFNGKQFENEAQIAVALAGRVLVKVTTKNGNISIGDLLTTSDIPGTAMRCDENCKLGNVVGKALESFSEKEGKILVLVNKN